MSETAPQNVPNESCAADRLLAAHERRRLAGVTLIDERTILRWERSETVRPSTKRALDDAARRLGLPVPPTRAAT